MIEIGTKILEVVWLLFRLIRHGGAQGLLAEVVILRQQLLVLKREKPMFPQDTIIGAQHRSPLKWKLFMRFSWENVSPIPSKDPKPSGGSSKTLECCRKPRQAAWPSVG